MDHHRHSDPGCSAANDDRHEVPPRLDQLDPPLPARVVGVLNRAGLDTVDKVAAATDGELLALPGIGPATVDAIRDVLAAQGPRHPLQQIPLEQLRTKLGGRLHNLLRRAHLRTVEEVAVITNAALLDLPNLGPSSVRSIRDITFRALAVDYGARAPVRLTGQQLREVIAITAELGLYAVEHNDLELRRRTHDLLQVLAPGFPAPEDIDPARPVLPPPPLPPLQLVRTGPDADSPP